MRTILRQLIADLLKKDSGNILSMRTEKKAVFGGYFNPFHSGHACVIKKCLNLKIVDKILIYVSFREKPNGRTFAGLDERRAIIKKWVELNGLGKQVCVYEGSEPIVNFFKAHGYTQTICGTDMFGISVKHGWEQFKLAGAIIVAMRPHFKIEKETVSYYTGKLHKTVQIIQNNLDISSSDIRDYVRIGASIRGMVPKGLEKDILAVYRPLLIKT